MTALSRDLLVQRTVRAWLQPLSDREVVRAIYPWMYDGREELWPAPSWEARQAEELREGTRLAQLDHNMLLAAFTAMALERVAEIHPVDALAELVRPGTVALVHWGGAPEDHADRGDARVWHSQLIWDNGEQTVMGSGDSPRAAAADCLAQARAAGA